MIAEPMTLATLPALEEPCPTCEGWAFVKDADGTRHRCPHCKGWCLVPTQAGLNILQLIAHQTPNRNIDE